MISFQFLRSAIRLLANVAFLQWANEGWCAAGAGNDNDTALGDFLWRVCPSARTCWLNANRRAIIDECRAPSSQWPVMPSPLLFFFISQREQLPQHPRYLFMISTSLYSAILLRSFNFSAAARDCNCANLYLRRVMCTYECERGGQRQDNRDRRQRTVSLAPKERNRARSTPLLNWIRAHPSTAINQNSNKEDRIRSATFASFDWTAASVFSSKEF